MQDINGYERFIGLLPGCYSMGVSHPETFVAGANLVLNSAEAPLTALTVYGKSTQDGTPSPENPVPIESVGEDGEITIYISGANLLDIDHINFNPSESTGLTVQLLDDGTIQVSGTPVDAYSKICSTTLSLPAGTYFISGGENADGKLYAQIAIKLGDTTVYYINTSFTITGEENEIRFLVQTGRGLSYVDDYKIKPMLNIGTTALPFEPYKQPQSLIVSTPNGLPGIPVDSDGNYTDENGQQWVCDEIDLARGKYVQRVGTETINGGYNLSETPDAPGRFVQYSIGFTNLYKDGRYESICNIASWSRWGFDNTHTNTNWLFALSRNAYYISPPSESGIESAEELNNLLNSLEFPVVFVGQLETPIETDLPAEEIAAYKALHTYSPATTVSNDAGVWMKVGYYGLTTIQKLEKEAIVINGGKS